MKNNNYQGLTCKRSQCTTNNYQGHDRAAHEDGVRSSALPHRSILDLERPIRIWSVLRFVLTYNKDLLSIFKLKHEVDMNSKKVHFLFLWRKKERRKTTQKYPNWRATSSIRSLSCHQFVRLRKIHLLSSGWRFRIRCPFGGYRDSIWFPSWGRIRNKAPRKEL